MTLNNVWVFAQVANGVPTTGTLELLTKARAIGANVSAFIGADGASVAGVNTALPRSTQLAILLVPCLVLQFPAR
jgi:hypothetical protein